MGLVTRPRSRPGGRTENPWVGRKSCIARCRLQHLVRETCALRCNGRTLSSPKASFGNRGKVGMPWYSALVTFGAGKTVTTVRAVDTDTKFTVVTPNLLSTSSTTASIVFWRRVAVRVACDQNKRLASESQGPYGPIVLSRSVAYARRQTAPTIAVQRDHVHQDEPTT